MAFSLNKVQILGNVGKDPTIRAMASGDEIANFSVATSESWIDKSSGERKEKSEWHNVCVFNPHLVKIVKSYVAKGSTVYIEGNLQTRKWTDQSGQDRYSTEIVLTQFKGELGLVGKKPDNSSSPPAEQRRQEQAGGGAPSWDAPKGGDIDDDSIPF